MRSPEQEAAEALLAAAAEDEAVVRELLDNERIGDPAIGFHAQQAVEKLLKAVLAGRGIDYPFTHDLGGLLDEVGREEMPASLRLEAAEHLTPWATEFRYGGQAESKLNRVDTLKLMESFREWAAREISSR